ncbi:hypothetical protein ACFL6U_12735 [Planctomycetota bacterium]
MDSNQKSRTIGILVFVLFVLDHTSFAGGFSLAPKLGTTGVGADVVYRINNHFYTRIGGAAARLKPSFDFDGHEAQSNIKLETFNALLDWHVGKSPFRISTGIYYNLNKYDFSLTPDDDIDIGDGSYTPAEVGTFNANLRYSDKLAPYLGIGYNSAFKSGTRWGFCSDLGVFYSGAPKVDLSTTGSGVSDSDLNKEESEIQENLDNLKVYLVLNLGFYYRF